VGEYEVIVVNWRKQQCLLPFGIPLFSEIRKAGYMEDSSHMRVLWPVFGKKSKEWEEVRVIFELLPFSQTLSA